MTKLEFMRELADALKADISILTEEMLLAEMKGWDSIGLISVIALLNEIGINLKAAQVREAMTVSDIVALAGDNLEESF